MDHRIRISISVVAIACGALVALLYAGHDNAAAFAKLIASLGFVAVAVFSGASRSTWGRFILIGLVLSLAGDMFLAWSTESAFLFGLGSFLLAHVAFIVAFGVHGVSGRWIAASAVFIAAFGYWVAGWLLPSTPDELIFPVTAYIIVINVMVIAAFGTRGVGGHWLIVAGAVMFLSSDLSVAAQRLLQTESATYVWGLPLYYSGQVCLALSVGKDKTNRG
jgi:uncharacterized membrane protein YhhN